MSTRMLEEEEEILDVTNQTTIAPSGALKMYGSVFQMASLDWRKLLQLYNRHGSNVCTITAVVDSPT